MGPKNPNIFSQFYYLGKKVSCLLTLQWSAHIFFPQSMQYISALRAELLQMSQKWSIRSTFPSESRVTVGSLSTKTPGNLCLPNQNNINYHHSQNICLFWNTRDMLDFKTTCIFKLWIHYIHFIVNCDTQQTTAQTHLQSEMLQVISLVSGSIVFSKHGVQ